MLATKRIALLYPLRLGIWQGIVRGIFRYARPTKPWEFCLNLDGDPKKVLPWKPDGIIANVYATGAARILQRVRVPVVETAYHFPDLRLPRVGLDHEAIG